MRVLITGANGFVAKHLLKKLVGYGHEVYLTTHNTQAVVENKHVYKMDINDQLSIKSVLKSVKPDAIVHLAAQSNVPFSWENPVKTFETNVIGTINIVDSVHQLNPSIKLVVVGSSEEYGLTAKTESLLSENAPCLPQNPYATSKFAAGQLSLQLSKKNSLNLIHFRTFNHFGPGQRKGFVVSDFCSQIASIELKNKEPILQVGDISTYRDFLPVEDVTEAYVQAITKNIPNGTYNISSGHPTLIESMLEKLLRYSYVKIGVQRDKKRYRTAEVKSFAGNSDKFRLATGWFPSNDMDLCLKNTLNWWREQIKKY
jgi:GDP-4-dehydro-6-deoxy-D-mannose reductase